MSNTDTRPTIGRRLSSLGTGIHYVWEQIQKVLLLITILSVACAVIVVLLPFCLRGQWAPSISVNLLKGEFAVHPVTEPNEPSRRNETPAPEVVKPNSAPVVPPTSKSREVPPRKAQPRPDVVLVFDRSAASWKNDPDLFKATQNGAREFVSALGGQPRLTLVLLNNKVVLHPDDPAREIKPDDCRKRVEEVFVEGSLALYDGLEKALDRLRSAPGNGSPGSVVILTPARAQHSQLSLDGLCQQVNQPGRAVQFFPIVIGSKENDLGNAELIRELKDLAEKSSGGLRMTTTRNLAETVREVAALISTEQ
jgi:hypothetical protein